MAKYIVFKPCDLNDDEEPSSSILWKAKFSIGEKFQELIPESIFTLIDQKDKQISYPIAYWESEFNKLKFKKIYDFPFAKEFIWEFENELALTITINAFTFFGTIDVEFFYGACFIMICILHIFVKRMYVCMYVCM